MIKVKLIIDIQRGKINLKKGQMFDVEEIVVDTYKIKVPKKQKGKFDYVLINDKEGILVEEQ